MKKSITRYLVLVAVILCVAGAALAFAGFSAGASGSIIFDHGIKVITASDMTVYSGTVYEEPADIEIASRYADITFLPSDTEYWKYEVRTPWGEPTIEISANNPRKLKIAERDSKGFDIVNVDFFGTTGSYIKIYFPVDSDLSTVTINSVSGTIRYEKAPDLRSLAINTMSGEIYLSDFTAEKVTAKTISGEITVRRVGENSPNVTERENEQTGTALVSGPVEMEMSLATMSGEIEVEDIFAAQLMCEAISGDIDINGNAPWYGTDITATTMSGEVSARRIAGKVSMSSVSGNVTAQGAIDEAALRSTSGNILLRTSVALNRFSGEARTTSGDVWVSGDRMGNIYKFRGSGAVLTLVTTSGNVKAEFDCVF
ncbi:MAG: DUF4097 domain-containing protein [Oscillospiraceae bacterium]|nr:DUF4097 domain-containing protein [Oscillospiraceae bacterium]